MKHFLLNILVITAGILSLSSCVKDELSRQNIGKDKPVVKVISNKVTDNLLTFTIEADFNAAQFAYVVMEGKENPIPMPQSIVMNEVPGGLQSQVYNASDKTKVRVDFPCQSDTDYQIFAVAITDTGLLGEIVTHDVFVPDTEIPAIVKATVSGNVVTLEFNEPVFVNKKSSADVRYVKWGIQKVTARENLPLDLITVDGNIAKIACPKPANGAGYLVDFPKGLFVDKSGNEALGVESSIDFTKVDCYTSLGWDDAPVDFNVDPKLFQQAPASSFHKEGASVSIVFPFDIHKNEDAKNPVRVLYKENERTEYVNASYSVAKDKRTLTVVLPRAPKGLFDICLGQGVIYDDWGNVNANYEVTKEADFKYAAYDIKFGEYNVTSKNNSEFGIAFERSSAATVTMAADWFNIGRDIVKVDQSKDDKTIMPMLVGIVNYEDRTISFDGSWLYRGVIDEQNAFGYGFYLYGKDESRMFVFWGSGQGRNPIVVRFAEDGTLTDVSSFKYTVNSFSTGEFIAPFDEVVDDSKLTFVK